MPMVPLSAHFVSAATSKPQAKKVDYYDTVITGFILEVRPTGGATYHLRYRDPHGRQRQYKIGDAKSLTFDKAGSVSVFETTIRELGGLLAAYDLSKDKIFLQKARILADKLMPAFKTASGIPTGQVNFRTGEAAGAKGLSGRNIDYLSDLVGHLQADGLRDRSMEALLRRVEVLEG